MINTVIRLLLRSRLLEEADSKNLSKRPVQMSRKVSVVSLLLHLEQFLGQSSFIQEVCNIQCGWVSGLKYEHRIKNTACDHALFSNWLFCVCCQYSVLSL